MQDASSLNKSKETGLGKEDFSIESIAPEKELVAEDLKSGEVPAEEEENREKEQITSIGLDSAKEAKEDKEFVDRIVDTRSRTPETVPIKGRDKLTEHGDEEESKFIEGVAVVHDGSDKS